jgi:acetyl esterase/lipase
VPLDRHAKRLLDMLAAGGAAEGPELTPPELRDAMTRMARAVDARDVPIGGIQARQLQGPGGPLPVRVYTPSSAAGDVSPGLVYFHGGMGVFNNIETHDGLCRMLANASGCRVVSVEYRLAPEHPFPAAVEDSYFAAEWVCNHAVELRIDSARVAIGGDSHGATLAIVVCQLAKRDGGPRMALQLLLCPVTDLSRESESRRAFAEGYFINPATLAWATGLYAGDGAELANPMISPLRADDFAGLPPAHVHTAEFDPLRDEGKAYADALTAAGVKVRYACHEGMIHHFYAMAGAIPAARGIVAAIGAELRDALA